jgi:radical SAM protein with 4Fe4S-binding SPASM domain
MLDKFRYSLYRFKYNYAPYLKLSKPVDISLELSSFCTNICGYCYHSDKQNLPFKKGFMDYDLAVKILSQARDLGVHSIKTNWRGESTMHPEFESITAVAKLFSWKSTFIDRISNSNFNFRHDNESVFRGLCNQTKVKISFDSFIKEIFEKQRKGSNYEKTLANIDKFYNYKGRNNEMVIQSVLTNLNKDEDLEYEIKSRWPSAAVSIRNCVEGRVNKDLSQTVIERRDLKNRQSCLQAHNRMIIHWDGRVSPCCPSIKNDLIIGDMNKQSILEIWKSKEAKELRRSLKTKTAFQLNPCKTCSSFESYKNHKKVWQS